MLFPFFFLMLPRPPRSTLFPTRRSSDLGGKHAHAEAVDEQHDCEYRIAEVHGERLHVEEGRRRCDHPDGCKRPDRKSTRLNSSHSQISYAVFCLKKKKKQKTHI